jgi:hypothetical protein
LAELLIQLGGADEDGRDLASLPCSLVRAYGDAAVPYLERAISESPYAFVRTQSAEGTCIAWTTCRLSILSGRGRKRQILQAGTRWVAENAISKRIANLRRRCDRNYLSQNAFALIGFDTCKIIPAKQPQRVNSSLSA